MTLRTTGKNISTTTTNTMSSNTRIAADARNGSNNFKIVHLGKDQRPISVMRLATMEDPTWMRSATFNHLSKAMRGQMQNYTMADLVTVVANELPISTESAMEEAEATGEMLKKEVFMVENLEGYHFLDSKGKTKTVVSDKLKDRPADISYFTFLCNVNPKVIDKRILQDHLSISFSLKLPLSIYDTTTKSIVESIGKRSGKKDRSGATGLSKLVGATVEETFESLQKDLFKDSNEYEEDEGDGAGTGEDRKEEEEKEEEDGEEASSSYHSPMKVKRNLGQTTLSPKMARMMGATSSGVVTGYFGPCTFLDNQTAFDAVFGVAPNILSAQPLKNAVTVRDEVEEFVEHCKFDIFMASCRNYYVGVGSNESDTQATHAACKSICGLRMEEKVNGRTVIYNPDVLFGKFMELTPLLPDDASKWSTQLCTSFFNALTPELRVKMENDTFEMPALNQLNSKRDQIDALQTVRDMSAMAFKKLKEETDLIASIIARQSGGQSRRTGNQFVTESREFVQSASNQPPPVHPPNDTANRILAYGQKSPAEETIQKYSSRTPNPMNLPVKDIRGVLYPYRDDDPSYISKFPLGFRGCFKCGVETAHSDGFNSCPKSRTGDQAAKMAFFRELWIHKPHTKSSTPRNFGTGGNERRDNNVSHQPFAVLTHEGI